MLKQFIPAFRMVAILTVLTGLIYPGVVTGICQVFFSRQANGNLIIHNRQIIGSSLIGQNFSKPEYFHPRPSAAGNDGYDPTASSGSNLGPTSQKLYNRVKTAAAVFRKENPEFSGPIPPDAVTASGSGLDPEISIANANAQAHRIARARNVSPAYVEQLVASNIEGRDLGFLGEPRVNVLKLNLELDRKVPKR